MRVEVDDNGTGRDAEVEVHYYLEDSSERPEVLFGRRLRELRTSLGWSQTEIAARLGALGHQLHQTAIAKIEAGSRPLRLNEAYDLATVLDVPLYEFFSMKAEDLLVVSSPEDLRVRVAELERLLGAIDGEIEMARLEERAALKKRSLFRAELEAATKRLAEHDSGGEQ